MPKEIIYYNKGGTISLKHYVNNSQIVPTSATVSIYTGGGSTVVEEVACSINIDGTVTYTISAAQANIESEDWRAEWAFVYDSETYYKITLFDVIDAGGFYPTWTKGDLLLYESQSDTWYNNTQLDNFCNGAYQVLTADISNGGYELNLIKDPSVFKGGGIYKTLSIMYLERSASDEDIYFYKYKINEDKYNEFMKNVFFYIDKNRDEIVNKPQESSRFSGRRLVRRGYNY